ncbi:Uncharacterised protein [Klebsiella pneumoniae]|uniref:Uncharacterized protein n=1 Tax=Klebsiella pneumoniae TaxID=573 RepID=A0A7H9ZE50_KLEPN|nr:Uncharacterised protein [Serratia marcescens]SWB40567.1 Uncharacterised protein [Klebsiella pneumoniae]SWB93039.1 Uncharacterised protein [Klebsiella pneumoniae]SWG59187.1 Uncharacterised protein [Klebsiella pneumoniae]SWG91873.1 Uncharacterised protein [Klebsiella pneumoniae]
MEINLCRWSRGQKQITRCQTIQKERIKMGASIYEDKIIVTSDTVNNCFPEDFRRFKSW